MFGGVIGGIANNTILIIYTAEVRIPIQHNTTPNNKNIISLESKIFHEIKIQIIPITPNIKPINIGRGIIDNGITISII
jgi:hypothetical protein